MMKPALIAICLTVGSMVAPQVSSDARASDTEALSGETIRYIIGSRAGGGSDRLGRILSDALKRALPDTTVRVQNLRGAGGGVATAEVIGATGKLINLALVGNGSIYTQLAKGDEAQVDLSDVSWIGSSGDSQRLVIMRAGLGPASLDTLKNLDRQPILAGPGSIGSSGHTESVLLNALAGLNLKVVPDVSRDLAASLLLAGDIDVMLGSYASLKPLIDSGDMVPVLTYERSSAPDSLKNLPDLEDVIVDAKYASIVEFLQSMSRGGRKLLASASLDGETIDALRAAFARATTDPQWLADMEANGTAASAIQGAELETQLDGAFDSDSEFAAFYRVSVACGLAISDGERDACD